MKTRYFLIGILPALALAAGCSSQPASTSDATPASSAATSNSNVLVQEMHGEVVRSERTDDGFVVTILDADGVNRRFWMEYSTNRGIHYEHHVLPIRRELAGASVPAKLSLDGAARASWSFYRTLPSSLSATAYDSTGCDLGGYNTSQYYSCSKAGRCCDTHDYCYYQGDGTQSCSEQSWNCSAARDYLTSCSIPGSCAADVKAKAEATVAGCSSTDLSANCAKCNSDVASCFVNSFSGNPAGVSSCCADSTCGQDRSGPTTPDGRTECSNGSTTPSCGPGGSGASPSLAPGPAGFSAQAGAAGATVGGSVLASYDPNEKTGPAGRGPQHVVLARDVMPYVIDFENMPPATATAQEIVIVDQLDPNLDWSALVPGTLSFGDTRVDLPADKPSYEVVVAPKNNGCDLAGSSDAVVRVALQYDALVGRIEVRLKVVDPVTGGWPADAATGILPPSKGKCSQGALSFDVRAKAGVVPGTVIRNAADIVFDANPPVRTNEVSNRVVGKTP